MKVIINAKFKKLLKNDLEKNNLTENIIINNNVYNDIFNNLVLVPSTKKNIICTEGKIRSNKKYSNEDIYFNSLRIDSYYLGNNSNFIYFTIGLFTGGVWLGKLKEIYKNSNIVCTIFYDKGNINSNIPKGFFIKVHEKIDFDIFSGKNFDIDNFDEMLIIEI